METLLHEIFAPAMARKGRDLDVLLHRAVMLAGVPIWDAAVLFPAELEDEQKLFASMDPWSEAERVAISTRLAAMVDTPMYGFAGEAPEADGHRHMLVTFGSGDDISADHGRFHGIAAVDTYADPDGVLMPGDEVALVGIVDTTSQLRWAVRLRLPDPRSEVLSGIVPGIEVVARKIMHVVSGRVDGVGPGHVATPIEIPPLFEE